MRKYNPKLILAAISSLHVFLLSRLVFFPYPELFIYSYLTEKGLVPYEQILDQHFPGIMFFPINLASLGLNTISGMRVLHLGLILLTHIVLFYIAKKIFKSNKWALSANLLFVVWQPYYEGYVFWIDSFVVPIILTALFILMHGYSPRKYFFSGLLLGLAVLFKQVAAPLAILTGLYLWFKSKKVMQVKYYIAGLALPIIFMFVWVSYLNIWKDFVYWTLTFNLTTFAETARKYPNLGGLIKAFPVYGLSVAGCFYFVVTKKSKQILLLGLFLIGSLAFAYARFDFIHLQPSLPFGVLLLIYTYKKLSRRYKVLVLTIYTLVTIYFLVPFYKNLARQKVIFFGDLEKRISKQVLTYVKENDSVFALGTTPHIYYLTNTLPPDRIFVFQFPWFMLEAEDRILSGIINDPPKVVVRDLAATTGGLKLVDYMLNTNRYIDDNYELVGNIDSVEILIPK